MGMETWGKLLDVGVARLKMSVPPGNEPLPEDTPPARPVKLTFIGLLFMVDMLLRLRPAGALGRCRVAVGREKELFRD
jgi:hypothetical protein